MAKTDEQSGSGVAGGTIHKSLQKLRNYADIAVKTLANVE
jgi:hypothetical protein